jgi:hypothetical protein
MNRFIEQLTTGKDNHTPDLGRWSWAICLMTICGIAVYMVVQNATNFSLRELAESMGIISAAHGVAIFAKRDTEPDSVENDTK